MDHTYEFHTNPKPPPHTAARELAAVYSRVFNTDDGKRILKDLAAKFNSDRSSFVAGGFDTHKAAWFDGQAVVIREIREAVAAGSPITGLPTP